MRFRTFLLMIPCLILGDSAAALESGVAAMFIDGSTGFGAMHAISGDGSRIVFESSHDLAGANSDLNNELFLWDDVAGFSQLTNTTGSSSSYWQVDIDADGSDIAVVARADITGSSTTLTELYRWHEGSGWTQLTSTAGALEKVFIGGIGISGDGSKILFTSRGDHAGINAEGELEIFLWDATLGMTQITNFASCGSGGGNFGIDLSGNGKRIVFSSRCQINGGNTDLQGDLYLWDSTNGFTALTNETSSEAGARGTINADGTVLALVSGHDLKNGGWGSAAHLFRWVEGSGFAQLTTVGVKENDRPSVDADGNRIVFSAENGQGTSSNPEATPELFLWQQGWASPTILTDSTQADAYYGNQSPDISDDGNLVSMLAFQAFDAPLDTRTGHFLLDIALVPEPSMMLLQGASLFVLMGLAARRGN